MLLGVIVLVVWGGAVVWCDVTTRHIPNVLSVAGALASACLAMGLGHYFALIPGLLWWLWTVTIGSLYSRARAGGADAKLGITVGTISSLVHPGGAIVALGAAGAWHVLGHSAWRVIGGGVATQKTMPHAPAMIAGLATALVWGQVVG